ncbi:MAG TPA: hypothetical protein VMV44_16350 [Rectinemataceae bacterium]|nr:hypothetical protein [Rectinemataceae bacterium]
MKPGLFLGLIFAFLGSTALAAQDVESWFARASDAKAYASVRQDFVLLAERSISDMHSDRPLAERLAEGARKHVAPDRLLSALSLEMNHLFEVAADIEARGLLPTDSASAGNLMSQVGIALRAGLQRRDIDAAFDGSVKRVGSGQATRDRAVAVLSAVAGLSLNADQRFALVGALAASPLPTPRFRGVRGTLADLLARNMTPEEATIALIASFQAQPSATSQDRSRAGGEARAGTQTESRPQSTAERPSAEGGDHEGGD